MKTLLLFLCFVSATLAGSRALAGPLKPRIIVTSDGEIDDQCSMIRFMLYTNECDVEAIISSSSQYHAHDKSWAGDDWIEPDLAAYAKVYPNLIKHDPRYPTPKYLRERVALGNVKTEGDMAEPTAGSDLIVKVLLDESDGRPVWMQAWGGLNTIARALKTIEEDHPERMAEVAKKARIFGIWEQDRTYQDYIRPVWGKYEIETIISDQFEAIAYRWQRIQPPEMAKYFEGKWMRENILENHGPLTAIYASHENGDFRSEGDSPAFLHTIVTGLRNMESPDWGGWGGRYVRVRENTWLDPVPVSGYSYPKGRWYGNNGWGRHSLRDWSTATDEQRREYFKPMWRWTQAMQNDFAARADWCVKDYEDANHPPEIKLAHGLDLVAKPGETVQLNAKGTTDPDKDKLKYTWWQYVEADTYSGNVAIRGSGKSLASFTVPSDAGHAETIHIVCEVTDVASPPITRYQRVVVTVDNHSEPASVKTDADGKVEVPPMVAHFRLDGDGGSVVVDEISLAQGTLENADPAVSWIQGVDGSGVHLDGHDDRIVIPHNDAFDFGDESFSITFWMRWPKGLPAGHERLLTKGDFESAIEGETGKRYEILFTGEHLRFNIDDDVSKSQIQVSSKPFTTGEWVHVAAVRDRKNQRLRLYANGELLPTNNVGNPFNDGRDETGSIKNRRSLYIGDSSRMDVPYQGDLDDLRFFRAALNHNQVAAIAAKAPLVEKEPEVVQKERVRPAKESELPPMSAHFPLDEGQGLVVREAIGGAKVELQNGNADTAWTSSDKGLALKMDGVDDRIIVPNAPGFDFEDESFSVAFHMRWTKGATPRHEHVLCKGDYESSVKGETGRRWEINMTPGGVMFIVDDNVSKSQIRVSDEYVLKGLWVHVAAIRDTESKQLKLYLNGELQESTDPKNPLFNGADQTGSISNPRELLIGDSSRRDNPLPGELSDIRIYRAALSASEVEGVRRLKRSAAANPEHGYAGAKPPAERVDNRNNKPRVIVTSDGEVDDECSLVRFLLYTNEWDVEGIISSSSQYHWQGHRWAGDDWAIPYLDAYEKVYPNLLQHDDGYPSPEYLRKRTVLGNIASEGDMETATVGSDLIVSTLLDSSDNRPVWLQAWGGTNTIARALKTIEEDHPDRMEEVAAKLRFFFIWEQDETYQNYILPAWGKYDILTIISDQFWAVAYQWNKIMPDSKKSYFESNWMKSNILQGHGELGALYKSHVEGSHGLSGDKNFVPGDFRSEGDSPAFLHVIPTGLRSLEQPSFGGWGGRYIQVRENTWLDPVPVAGYVYPEGRWYTGSAFGRRYMRDTYPEGQDTMQEYFKPTTRWADAMQNDFASRADWCVKSYDEANHPPEVVLAHPLDLVAAPNETVQLSAQGTRDPEGDELTYRWWQYEEADSHIGQIEIRDADEMIASFVVPANAQRGKNLHIVCEVTDTGSPALTRYQRVIVTIE